MESRQFRLKKIKSQIRLFIPLALMVLSLVFIGVGQFENIWLSHFKIALIETVSPIAYFISAPIRWGQSAIKSSSNLFQTYQQNKELLAEIEELKEWKNKAIQLQAEQEALKKTVNYQVSVKSTYITAPVLLDNGGRFAQSLVVQAGHFQGVEKGDVAITSNGVFGRVVEVGQNMSRLMLLTDYASRVPVRIGNEQIMAILTGDGSLKPKITALPENHTVMVGDIVLTSGQVGVFPNGLPIGVVETVENDEVRVILFERETTPRFVKLFNFGLQSVLLSSNSETEGKKK